MVFLEYHDRDYAVNTNVMQAGVEITGVSTIAERIKSARLRRKLTQSQLAKDVGISQGTIGNLESGTRERPRDLLSIALALGVNVNWLAYGRGPMMLGEQDAAGEVWPFPDIDRGRFDRLPLRQQIEIQGLVRKAIGEFEAMNANRKAA